MANKKLYSPDTVIVGRNGKYNSAGSFDETDDYVKVSSLDLSGTDAVSLSFWFKHNYENSNNRNRKFRKVTIT